MAGKNFLRRGTQDTAFSAVFDQIEGDVLDYVERLARTLHEEVIDATVTYTGEVRQNWKASSGQPDNSPAVKSNRKGEKDRWDAEAKAIAMATAANFDFSKLQDHVITNSSDAVLSLEMGELPEPGKSRAPPEGMTQRAIAETLRKVK